MPYVAPVRTQLVIGAEGVESADVTIDGQRVQLWEPADVTAGTHDVVVQAAGYEPERRRVVTALGRFVPVDVTLRPKPGRLSVRAERGATLYVDGRRLGTLPGEPVRVAPGRHFVSVARRGRASWDDVISVERDRELVLDATLAATGQRRAAWWVLGGGATVGTAAGLAAGWAYAARRDANDLDARRRGLTATPADLARYNERVDDERLRSSVATGLGLGALALGVVGLGLWWFDTPAPGAPPRTRLEVLPAVRSDEVGLTLGGRF